MHEMSICASIVTVIEQQAVAESFTKVNVVRLEIGPLAGVEIEALRFSFGVVANGGIAQNARLDIVELPVIAWCVPCAKSVHVNERFDACPDCGDYQVKITGGDELRIKDLEVE